MAENENKNQGNQGGQGSPKAGAAPQARPQLPGEITIEIADDRNRNTLFPPISQMNLRGRWSRNNLTPDEMSELVTAAAKIMTDIPGIHITLDARRRFGRLFDPLGEAEYKERFDALKQVMKPFDGGNYGPVKGQEYSELNDSQVKTWLYWMHRLVQGKSARVVSGTLPTLKEIEALPGKTRIEVWNNSPAAKKFREDLPKVPDEEQAVLL